jgi:hypothetical protein
MSFDAEKEFRAFEEEKKEQLILRVLDSPTVIHMQNTIVLDAHITSYPVLLI